MDKNMLNWLDMARIDIKNQGDGNDVKFTVLKGVRYNLYQANWFSKGSKGYVFETYDKNIVLKLLCVGSGELLIRLRGIDRQDRKGKRLPIWVDYTRLVVNGKTDFCEVKSLHHDKPYVFNKTVEDGELVNIEISWEEHKDNKKELGRLLYARKNYALITGAIRNEFYLRMALIKMCDMRSKGIIKEIVLSTWEGDVDKCGDLRECLDKLGIIIVERPYIDELAESKFNQLGFQRQRTLIASGLAVVPNDCFVLKLRTDFLAKIDTVLELVEDEIDLTLENYGRFPHILNYKVLMRIHGLHRLTFADDRFFYGYKPDLEKMYIPVMNKVDRKFVIYMDHELTSGFCYLSYPLLKGIWNIVSLDVFPKFVDYCRVHDEKGLRLPRLFLRVFAINCVYLYTHVYIANPQDLPDDGKPIALVDLFRNKVRTNDGIRKILEGNIKDKDSQLACIFYDELRKISLNDYSTHGYTKDEYDDFRKFVVEELCADEKLVAPYPFIEHSTTNSVDKRASANILLDKYHDPKFTEDVTLNIENGFEMFSEMYRRLDSKPENKEIVLKAAIFDVNYNPPIAATYMKYVADHVEFFDVGTWNQVLRYMRIALFVPNKDLMLALYYTMGAYNNLLDKKIEIRDTWPQISYIAETNLKKCGGNISVSLKKQQDYLRELVCIVNKSSIKDSLDRNDFVIIDVLMEICPTSNPFSQNLIKKIEDDKKVLKIQKMYHNVSYTVSEWEVSNKLMLAMKEMRLQDILADTENIFGVAEVEAIINFLHSVYWKKTAYQSQISVAIDSLGNRLSEQNFIVKVHHFLLTGELLVSAKDMMNKDNYFILLEMLYCKGILSQNVGSLKEMCFGEKAREMLLNIFLHMEDEERLEFFSMKNGNELWLHYVPYLKNEKCKFFEVPVWGNGKTWPGADRENKSAFAAYMRIMGNDVYISIEFSAKDTAKARILAQLVGFEEKNSPSSIIRLLTKRIPIEGAVGMEAAVKEALDEFCAVGEKLVAALDSMA